MECCICLDQTKCIKFSSVQVKFRKRRFISYRSSRKFELYPLKFVHWLESKFMLLFNNQLFLQKIYRKTTVYKWPTDLILNCLISPSIKMQSHKIWMCIWNVLLHLNLLVMFECRFNHSNATYSVTTRDGAICFFPFFPQFVHWYDMNKSKPVINYQLCSWAFDSKFKLKKCTAPWAE